MTIERRHGEEARAELRRQLNEDQRIALSEIERYGWQLRFIRHPPFRPPIVVAADSEHGKFVVLESDGQINDRPGFPIRQ